MCWAELERLVETVEADGVIRRALGHCRSLPELVLACRRLGFAIDPADLRQARDLDRGPRPLAAGAAAAHQPLPMAPAAAATVRTPLAS